MNRMKKKERKSDIFSFYILAILLFASFLSYPAHPAILF